MKKIKILKIGLVAILATIILCNDSLAWGPERTLFTNENPATYATFNSITNNAAVGDERDFVRIVEVGTGAAYSNEVKIQGGKEYQVYIYYHNNASSTFNQADENYSGVAREVKLATQFPVELEKNQKGTVSATISASNTNPAKVWDEAYVTAKEKVKLAYKVGSAKIFNDWGVNGSVLSTNLFSSGGTYLGLNELNGVILGCDEYSGQVVYTLVATKVEEESTEPAGPTDPEPEEPTDPEEPEKPTDPEEPKEPEVTPDPDPENQPEKEEVPEELPKTGPAEIVLAIVIVLGLGAWGIYYWNSQKTLKRVRSSVMGNDDKNISQDE